MLAGLLLCYKRAVLGRTPFLLNAPSWAMLFFVFVLFLTQKKSSAISIVTSHPRDFSCQWPRVDPEHHRHWTAAAAASAGVYMNGWASGLLTDLYNKFILQVETAAATFPRLCLWPSKTLVVFSDMALDKKKNRL